MTSAISIILFVVAVSVLAFIHELGHFLAARLFNIEVEEFGLGFPPRALKLFNYKGTDFTLNWIPFGAFVRPKGENDPEIPGGLGSAHPLKRLVVLLGGPVMNIIAGVILFSLVFAQTGIPDTNRVEIGGVVKDSAAEQSGLLTGDQVVKANDTTIQNVDVLRGIIQANPEKPITFVISRSGQQQTLQITPRSNPQGGTGVIGVYLSNPVVKASWIESIPVAANVSVQYCRELLELPGKLIMGQLSADQSRLTSIVGLGNMFVQARERDIQASETPNNQTPAVSSLTLLAIISVALGITNLLPIPALDGGRILFLLPELVVRKRIPPRYENAVHMAGFMLLLVLMFVITIQDIVNPVNLP
jgi:regulator of sigma E protease